MSERDGHRGRSNLRTSLWLVLLVGGMFAFGYALVPLYNVFCQIAGIGDAAIQVAESGSTSDRIDRDRVITVEFTGDVMGGLPWETEPAQKIRVHPGENVRVAFRTTNLSDIDVVGQAVPSVTPVRATRHFVKTECFCFSNQTLAANETREMPVLFRVDTALPKEVKTITLSYSFYRAEADAGAEKPQGASADLDVGRARTALRSELILTSPPENKILEDRT